MPSFSYEVKQPTGSIERGTAEGESAQAVARQLQAQGYFVVKINRIATPRAEGLLNLAKRRYLAPILTPVSNKSLATYFTSLQALLSAGMSVSEAMRTLSTRTRSRTLAQASREMAEEAVRGRPMTSVMQHYPAAFNQASVAMMEAGEQSGLIEKTAKQLAAYFDRAFQLEQSYRWQTFYPKLLIIATVVIPTLPTLVLRGLNQWVGQIFSRSLPLLIGLLVAWYGWRFLMQVQVLKRALDSIKLAIPWFGSLSRRLATARWARALAMLSGAGVPIHHAMVAAAAASGNKAMEASLVKNAEGVLYGQTVNEVITASKVFPYMVTDMLSAAEKAGSYEGALEKVAEYYESETEVGGKQTAMAVGLGLYLLVALVIAFMVISFWKDYFGDIMKMMEP